MGLTLFLAASAAGAAVTARPAAPEPTLEYAFTARINLGPPVELGTIAGGRRRFIPITEGTVGGPRLAARVLAGGGDWQTIFPDGLTRVEAHYILMTEDGVIVEILNPGLRTADARIADLLAQDQEVDPSAYYFRTTPRFEVAAEEYAWLRRSIFVARGIRKPDHVVIDFYFVR